MDKVKVAVVGAGAFGIRHAHVYAGSALAELRAVVRRDERRAREVAERFGVRWYTDVGEMLASEPLDAVSIATRTQQHAEPTIQCAQAGKHILLEKPMASTLEEADAIIKATQQAGVKLMVNSILRFDPRYATTFESIQRGDIGEPVTFSARRVGLLSRALESADWNELVLGTGIHEIDLMIWYSGSRVKHVYAEAETRYTAAQGLEDVVFSLLRFENGAIGCIENSWLLPPGSPRWIDSRMDVVGTKGSIHIDGYQGMEVVTSDRFELPDILSWPVIRGDVAGNLREVITYFLECILEDKDPVPGGPESREALAVALALKRSCAIGEPVRLDDVR